MKVYFRLENGSEYYFKDIKALRDEMLYKSWGIYYSGLLVGLEQVYGKIDKLIIGKIRLI